MFTVGTIPREQDAPDLLEYHSLARTPLLPVTDEKAMTESRLLACLHRKSVAQALKSNNNALTLLEEHQQRIIDANKKLMQLMDERKIIPQTPKQKPGIVNKLSQRLFCKNDQLYSVYQRHLDSEKIAPTLATIRGIFVIVLVADKENTLFLELRLQHCGNRDRGGHDSLADDNHDSLLCAGEIDIIDGVHKISSDLTSYHERIKGKLGLTPENMQGLIDLCLGGLGSTFYAMKLLADSTELDMEDYESAKENAGITPSLLNTLNGLEISEKRKNSLTGLSAPSSLTEISNTMAPLTPTSSNASIASNISEVPSPRISDFSILNTPRQKTAPPSTELLDNTQKMKL